MMKDENRREILVLTEVGLIKNYACTTFLYNAKVHMMYTHVHFWYPTVSFNYFFVLYEDTYLYLSVTTRTGTRPVERTL